MADGFYKDVAAEISRLGFSFWKAAKGSHEKWRNDHGKVLIVPHNLKSRHTANGILRDAGSAKRI